MLFSCSSSILLAIRTAIGSCCFAISCEHNINSAAKYSSWFVSYCFLLVATMLSRFFWIFLCKCKTQFIYFYLIFWFFTLFFFLGGGGDKKGERVCMGVGGRKRRRSKQERKWRGGGGEREQEEWNQKWGVGDGGEENNWKQERGNKERRDREKRRTGVANTHHCTNPQRFVNCHLLLSSHKQNGRAGFSPQPKDLPPLSTNGSGVR